MSEHGGSVTSGGVTSANDGDADNDTAGVIAVSGTSSGSAGRAVGGWTSAADGGSTSAADGGSTSAGHQSSGSGGAELGGEDMGGTAAGGSPGAGGQGATANGDLVAQGVRWVGRVSAEGPTRFAWSGAGFVARFSGTGLSATLTNAEGYLFQIVIDGAARDPFLAKRGETAYPLATGLTPGEHVVELYRQTEGRYGDSQLEKIEVVDGELLDPPPGPDGVLEVIGDSITCGYGNLGADASCSFSFATESHWHSYGAVAGRALGVDVHTIAISGHGLTRNNDGTTSDLLPDVYERTLARDPSLLWSYSVSPKVVVVNLGTNDFAQGNPGANFETQYLNFLTKLRALHPNAFLLATLGPMMNGSNLNAARAYIRNAVSAFEADGNAGKVGFLEYTGQVTGELGCNSHPNASKHKQMADVLVAEINELNLY